MSLLLSQAARLAGWTADRWRDGWPDLLTAHEIARLEAGDDRQKERDILALFAQDPPPADEVKPGPHHIRKPTPDEILDWEMSGKYAGEPYPKTLLIESPPVVAYRAETYAKWPARDWQPSPMVSAWLASAGADDATPDTVNTSDAALGADRREQMAKFAKTHAEETRAEREREWLKWNQEAERILEGRTRKTSKRELARLVKTSLKLPDSIETIRKKLPADA